MEQEIKWSDTKIVLTQNQYDDLFKNFKMVSGDIVNYTPHQFDSKLLNYRSDDGNNIVSKSVAYQTIYFKLCEVIDKHLNSILPIDQRCGVYLRWYMDEMNLYSGIKDVYGNLISVENFIIK
jgi:hypothetical protein